MIPIRDNIPSRARPWVEYSIITITAVVFIYQLGRSGAESEAFFRDFGLIPARLTGSLQDGGSGYFGLISSMFLHGGVLHFLGNMWFLRIFGDNIEDHIGHGRFAVFYILSGIVAGLAQVLSDPDSPIPMIGASGAVAGVMGAYLVLYPKARVLTLIPIFFFISLIEVPAVFFLGIWFVIQLYSGTMTAAAGAQGGVAFWAHAGGFVAGILVLGLLGGWRRPEPPSIRKRRPFSGGWRS
jgi:membrane associated rhomboid family serine protease